MKSWLVALLLLPLASFASSNLPLNKLTLPKGFTIQVYAKDVPDAREMALGQDGTVYVGTRHEDKVYALINPTQNFNQPAEVKTILSGLNSPNGVAVHDGDLYVAENNEIVRYPDIAKHISHPVRAKRIEKLPKESHHGWRYIKFGPDGLLYVGIGAPCNVCISKNKIFATIIRMKDNGKDSQIYANGVRNTVGFAWNPVNQQLWFTDNGRDWLGDKLPPDEINIAPHKDMDFGFPYYFGNNQPDPKYGVLKTSEGMTPASLDLPAHVAPLGMLFYTGKMFPAQYHNQVIVAEHGSWNSSVKVGYQLILVNVKDNKPVSWQPFVTGWLKKNRVWGRPVDVLQLPDGSILVSDDYAGVIYRISYKG